VLLHGIAKLKGGVGPIEGMVAAHGWPSYVAYGALVGEVLGPLLLLVGFYARVGAALIAINMLFAFALVHIGPVRPVHRAGRLGAGTAGDVPGHRAGACPARPGPIQRQRHAEPRRPLASQRGRYGPM
jgi:hypothetical protein